MLNDLFLHYDDQGNLIISNYVWTHAQNNPDPIPMAHLIKAIDHMICQGKYAYILMEDESSCMHTINRCSELIQLLKQENERRVSLNLALIPYILKCPMRKN
ncbi:MAG TPA: hypothetical protein DDZ09_08880 [Alcaligenes faecalis]|nr:hypothetical protein [Alcaligenes faecalis]